MGQVYNPATASNPDSPTPMQEALGRQGEQLRSAVHGDYYVPAYRGNSFWFNVTAVTVPVVANNLVSVYTLWNPPSSNVIGELIDTEIGQVLAATVVDSVGWYFSAGSQALAGTFTTKAIANTNYGSARIGDPPANKIIPYSAYTHSGTPVRADIIALFGAVTDASMAAPQKLYNGRLLIPPGVAMSVAMSTAAGTATGLDVSARWSEWLV